jgi:hypothetical protein
VRQLVNNIDVSADGLEISEKESWILSLDIAGNLLVLLALSLKESSYFLHRIWNDGPYFERSYL